MFMYLETLPLGVTCCTIRMQNSYNRFWLYHSNFNMAERSFRSAPQVL